MSAGPREQTTEPARDVVARAKAALEGVTAPWSVDPDGTGGEPDWDDGELWLDVNGAHGGWVAHCQDRATAEFIAAARSLVPELVAEVERLRSVVGGEPT
jgi:hypothetical protein